jgi:hypothetical protein
MSLSQTTKSSNGTRDSFSTENEASLSEHARADRGFWFGGRTERRAGAARDAR